MRKERAKFVNEITGMEDDVIQSHEIFRYVKEHTDAKGNIVGYFAATGIQPQFLQALLPYGIKLPSTNFDPGRRM